MTWKVGQSLTSTRLGGIVAKYARTTGSQALSAGDQACQFPTAILTSSQVTAGGSGNSFFTLSEGDWGILVHLRFSTSVDTGLYIATGTTFTNENNVFAGSGASQIVAHVLGAISVPTTQSIVAGVYSGVGSRDIVPYGVNLTSITFIKYGPAA